MHSTTLKPSAYLYIYPLKTETFETLPHTKRKAQRESAKVCTAAILLKTGHLFMYDRTHFRRTLMLSFSFCFSSRNGLFMTPMEFLKMVSSSFWISFSIAFINDLFFIVPLTIAFYSYCPSEQCSSFVRSRPRLCLWITFVFDRFACYC